MSIVALNENGERVDLFNIDNPKSSLKDNKFFCQYDGKPLFLKAGLIRRPHFAHYPQDGCSNPQPESYQHILAKWDIATRITKSPKYQGGMVEVEAKVGERIADILVTLKSGVKEAHEIQLSHTTVEELEARSNDYWKEGVNVIWYFSKTSGTKTILEYCLYNFGEVVTIDFEYKDYRDTDTSKIQTTPRRGL